VSGHCGAAPEDEGTKLALGKPTPARDASGARREAAVRRTRQSQSSVLFPANEARADCFKLDDSPWSFTCTEKPTNPWNPLSVRDAQLRSRLRARHERL
jgi:hypothetical protein